METYNFTRPTLPSGIMWSASDKDNTGKTLRELIDIAIPGHEYSICADGTNIDIIFTDSLSSQGQTDLSDVVNTFSPIDATLQTKIQIVSPNGTVYSIIVDDDGTLITE